MKIWITKYALTSGIAERETEIEPDDGYVYVKEWIGRSQYKLGKDAFPNPISAAHDAESRRVKEIACLRKKITSLEALSFGVFKDVQP